MLITIRKRRKKGSWKEKEGKVDGTKIVFLISNVTLGERIPRSWSTALGVHN